MHQISHLSKKFSGVKAGIICLRTLGFDKDEQEMATAFLCLEILFPQKFEAPRND
jgi:hypothetical protein